MIARRLPPEGGAGWAAGGTAATAAGATDAGAGDEEGDGLAAALGELMDPDFLCFS